MIGLFMKIKCIADVHNGISLKEDKIYEAIQGQKGWYALEDETGERYVYPPHLFEVIEDDLIKYQKKHKDEKEIQFIKQSECYQEILSICESYFDDIINLYTSGESGWTGLARYYHSKTGWYEKNPWKIPYVKDVLREFKKLEIDNLKIKESKEIFCKLRDFLEEAVQKNECVWISLRERNLL